MTGWTIEVIRTELDLPLVHTMFEEWQLHPPGALSLLRLQRAVFAWAGIKEKTAARREDADGVQDLLGDMVPGERLKIMKPEEWMKRVRTDGRPQ